MRLGPTAFSGESPEELFLQVFAHKQPFSRISSYLILGLVFAGKRPSRPPNREIIGLSEDIWMLAEKCWDPDLTPSKKFWRSSTTLGDSGV